MSDPLVRLRQLLGVKWNSARSVMEDIQDAANEIERLRAQGTEEGTDIETLFDAVLQGMSPDAPPGAVPALYRLRELAEGGK